MCIRDRLRTWGGGVPPCRSQVTPMFTDLGHDSLHNKCKTIYYIYSELKDFQKLESSLSRKKTSNDHLVG